MTQHWLIGGLLALCLFCCCVCVALQILISRSVLSLATPPPPPPCSLICVMLALACEESLRCHSANPCQANRQTWCQPSQFIIPALLLNISTAADWSASWRQPKCVPVWYINYLTHCQLWYKTQTKKTELWQNDKANCGWNKVLCIDLPRLLSFLQFYQG